MQGIYGNPLIRQGLLHSYVHNRFNSFAFAYALIACSFGAIADRCRAAALPAVRIRIDIDDPRRRAVLQQRKKALRDQERRQMVDGKNCLELIFGFLANGEKLPTLLSNT